MIKMTFDEYDNTVNRLTSEFKADRWPKKQDLETKWECKTKADIEYLIWVMETAPEPEDSWEVESKRKINELLCKNLKLTNC